jgi:hypothetical protein
MPAAHPQPGMPRLPVTRSNGRSSRAIPGTPPANHPKPALSVTHGHADFDESLAVVVGAGNGWWQAVIPAQDGEIVTTRYTLRALLDKLDELINANPGHD